MPSKAQTNNNDYINTTSSSSGMGGPGPSSISREESLRKEFNDSDYDTFMEKHGNEILRRKSTKHSSSEGGSKRKSSSRSRFYDDEQIDQLEDSQKLVTLMRDHNTKKEKSQRLKRRYSR